MTSLDSTLQLRDGRTLGYAQYGEPGGKPVFFLQGTPSSRLMHPDDSITCRLGVRLITVDRPGFGLSTFQPGRTLLHWPTDLCEVADVLRIERFAVVGISGGGPYVAACAHEVPHRLAAAAIVAGVGPFDAPGATQGSPASRRIGAFVARHLPGLTRPLIWLTMNPQRDVVTFFRRYTASDPQSDQAVLAQPGMREMFMASYAEATRTGVRGFAWEVRLHARPWGFRLEDIPMLVHLWHGEEDTSTPPGMARYVAKAIPESPSRSIISARSVLRGGATPYSRLDEASKVWYHLCAVYT